MAHEPGMRPGKGRSWIRITWRSLDGEKGSCPGWRKRPLESRSEAVSISFARTFDASVGIRLQPRRCEHSTLAQTPCGKEFFRVARQRRIPSGVKERHPRHWPVALRALDHRTVPPETAVTFLAGALGDLDFPRARWRSPQMCWCPFFVRVAGLCVELATSSTVPVRPGKNSTGASQTGLPARIQFSSVQLGRFVASQRTHRNSIVVNGRDVPRDCWAGRPARLPAWRVPLRPTFQDDWL